MPRRNPMEGLANYLAGFSSGPSVTGLPAGAHGGGRSFEKRISVVWGGFTQVMSQIADVDAVKVGTKIITRIQSNDGQRTVYFDSLYHKPSSGQVVPNLNLPPSWLTQNFKENDLLSWYPGAGVYRYAPPTPDDSPKYHGSSYLNISENKKTEFDGVLILAENGNLVEKLLLEYKSAKSSNQISIDGNAHERLAFQVLQYLEIAQKFPRTSFNVLASVAFARYKNKYHPAFHQQADRLGHAFSSFRMRFMSCPTEYKGLLTAVHDFIQTGTWSF